MRPFGAGGPWTRSSVGVEACPGEVLRSMFANWAERVFCLIGSVAVHSIL